MATSRLLVVFGAVGLLLSANGASANPGLRHASSPSYRNIDACPERCIVSGADTGNWSVFSNFDQIRRCKETMFYDFSIYDQVDDAASSHRIHACSSTGPDFGKLPPSTASIASSETFDVDFEVGWWQEGFGLSASGLRSVIKQMRQYADSGHGATDRPFIMFGQSNHVAVGLYIGQGLLNQGMSASALKILEDNLGSLNVSTPSLAMQLCDPTYDSTHIFGIMATGNGEFGPIQDAIQSWNNATCLSFSESTTLFGQAEFTTPLTSLNTSNSSYTSNSSSSINSTNSINSARLGKYKRGALHVRAECKTVQVESGDSCAALATKCGISGNDFTKYNPGSKFCATLQPKQHVCCSSGDLPDFSPQPKGDGSCYTYQVKANDNCATLAAEYGLTNEDIEDFNSKTWGWNGCELLFVDTIMCLSSGTAPFPASIANAVCGPQKPGSKPPSDGSDISRLNPCPLNACCNIWGQCGITKDFCVDTNTGAPGTAKPGTYGCISNCGTDIIKGSGTGNIQIGYFEGYGLGRECLFQDASQVDTSQFTHIHFAFGTLTTDYDVEVGDELSTYQFSQFKEMAGVKKILSFGGWEFSASPSTYAIFRTGVQSANRLTMATKIANFIKKNGLDGVDIDWEYPGAPDIPGIPAADEADGTNYLAFLVILKNLLAEKSVSIAAPSSYWYLKQYPLKQIGAVVDYIVYMTYDLHGQWDANNEYSQVGCDNGNCLRSHVNLTETKQSLAMITKAGVPGNKIVVGITSYGRSFSMAEAGCWGPSCQYTGDQSNSDATAGRCTGTAGYIADAEIYEIIKDGSRVTKSFVDSTSNSDVLVYDDNQWVSYMSSSTKKTRSTLYAAWGLGGTTDWATDLQEYHDVPAPAKSWAIFKKLAISGENPKTDNSRTGKWTTFDCTHEMISNFLDYTPSERWKGLGADEAWEDVIRVWKDTEDNRSGIKFMQSVSSTLKIGAEAKCEDILADNCNHAIECTKGLDGPYSGPAAQLIWNSLIAIHQLHRKYFDTLFRVAAVSSFSLDHMENTFAPIPPEPDNTWFYLFMDLLTIGMLSTAGPFFNSFLRSNAFFSEIGIGIDNVKDTSMNMIGQATTIAKDLYSDNSEFWSTINQDAFGSFMGQTINGWANVITESLHTIFDGSDASTEILWNTIHDGRLIEGKFESDAAPNEDSESQLRANVAKSLFGYTIPTLWKVSKRYAFIIDSTFDCTEDRPLSAYLDDDTMDVAGACVDEKLYYLVYPDGDATTCGCEYFGGSGNGCQQACSKNKFSVPPGLDSLDGYVFGGITKLDLIKGSVRTYVQNGKVNKKDSTIFIDPTDNGTITNLMNVDVTTPGFMRIPVCSAERAFQSWDTTSAGSSENYPCDIPPGLDTCGDSTFQDDTTGGSPLVDDCLAIITNIEGNGSTKWTTLAGSTNQRKIASSGTCAFGVEATSVSGNANFAIGGQDVIDIINEAINQFGKGGRIGASGTMACNGNIKKQSVKWGIYST